MSDLSVVLHKIGNFFDSVVGTAAPSARAQIAAAGQAISNAAAQAEQAVPSIAISIVDALETTYGASGYVPLTNAIFLAVFAEAEKRGLLPAGTTASAGAAAGQTASQTPLTHGG